MNKKFSGLLILLLLLVCCDTVFARGMGRMGEISEAFGDVYLLTDQTWIKVDVIPVSLSDGDKVMTHNGRASLELDGGTIVNLNRYSYLAASISLSEAETKGLDDETLSINISKSDRTLSLVLGEMWVKSTPSNIDAPLFLIKSPASTALMTDTSLEVIVGVDGEADYFASKEVKLSGRYTKHEAGIATDGTPGNILAHKTLLDALSELARSSKLNNLKVREIPAIASEVLSLAWPDMAESSLTSDLADKQLEESKKQSADAVAYLDKWIDATGTDTLPRHGSTLQSRPETIEEQRGIGRYFGMPGFIDPPEEQGDATNVRFHMTLDMGGMTESNVFGNAPGAELDDLITRVSPSIFLGMYGDQSRIEAAIWADSYSYGDYSDENYTAVTAQLGMRVGAGDGVYFAASDKYVSTEDRREQERAIKEPYTINTLRVELGYEPLYNRRFGAFISVDHEGLSYDEAALEPLNQSTIDGLLSLGYRVLPLTTLSLETVYLAHDYTDTLDDSTAANSTSIGGGLALTLATEGRADGHISVGRVSRDYVNDLDASGNRLPDVSYLYYDIDLTYKAGMASLVNVRAYKGIAEALDLSVGSIAFSAHYLRSGYGIAVSGRFDKWYGFDIDIGIESREYSTISAASAQRTDDVTKASLELKVFHSDWLMGAVGYAVMNIDSNDSLRDEEHDMVTFRIATGF